MARLWRSLEVVLLAGGVLLAFAVMLLAVRVIAVYLCTHGWLVN